MSGTLLNYIELVREQMFSIWNNQSLSSRCKCAKWLARGS